MDIEVTRDNGVATVTLNRADKLNALSMDMYAALGEQFAELDRDDSVRVVVLTGAGRAFCAGGDVSSMGGFDIVPGRKRSRVHHQMIMNLYNLEKPVIASIRGATAGIGASMALACDMIVASETAYLLMAFKNVGIPPDGGGIFFLTQHLGIAKAKELVFTARKLPAQEAKDLGLVVKVTPDAELEAATAALAREMAESATYALTAAKKMFNSMYSPTLEQLLQMEIFAITGGRLTKDHAEGIAAFREKRKAKFTGQ